MAGLYIHIPFCAKRCLYCDFFSNTDMKFKEPYVSAVIREMQLRQEYIGGEPLDTIYFGGGTPSQLQQADFERIFKTIDCLFNISSCKEITLEANPDDMTPEYVASLRNLPFNRVSMGVQSFKEKDLHFLNRRHDREQALRAVGLCKENGIPNISIDLIYGLPGQTLEEWQENLNDAIHLEIPHISAYHLIYEEGTALYKLMEAGKVAPIEEELSVTLFSTLINRLAEAGYLHYEISNFALPGYFSQHNSSYWTGKKYIGIGPSAHSYDGESRQWNISSLPHYLEGIRTGIPNIEIEKLDINTKYNDFIITGLRTMWGIRTANIREQFGEEKQAYLERQAATYLHQGLLIYENDTLTLSKEGIFISDGIMSDLLWV
ncbi:MAG TPA: radical SAM family heme chaperone HemW [Parabacteroides johnsonii]|jgi:putative oxygen-independent coproporphyrinogen III oxidase|uniref:Heme chaperone HemW n=1 Tax=Parabacteroides johnsonii TaxID=387661 RepID=A0A9Q5X720_9BACT|nr:radical SAM family heme chaperone HemW [Parabacteroides johnsonii]CCX77541.1 putative oxygen-independent coproporphyrinogen III oxidase [Parabacteroides johnsonii CAG:246]OUO03842.1 coproporphyrinogen III oxidase [Parabacteroides johnsonii]UEA90774.1 radical SAM family heme chaperone HemW [Parabacteroides johnsonii]UWP42929.1 radical SAM family heme chaperone HemW [Parabacteroides johnsonii DSM 18315]HJH00077.1 radical SAM family heme chaperone HemW [Parabacteroides johnsonii]